ncbi:MAG: hypothetical protein WA021_02365, partial [Minisyncoccia bacterium]
RKTRTTKVGEIPIRHRKHSNLTSEQNGRPKAACFVIAIRNPTALVTLYPMDRFYFDTLPSTKS